MLIARKQSDNSFLIRDHKDLFPNYSFPNNRVPSQFLVENDCFNINLSKDYNPTTQKLVKVTPYLEDNIVFDTIVIDLSEQELKDIEDKKLKEFMDYVETRVQSRLDTFAKTRRYDGIMSAASYSNSELLRFSREGKYAAAARDTTWSVLYDLIDSVSKGLAPMPSNYETDIEPLLPELVWPVDEI